MRIAIIGAGTIGQLHAAAAEATGQVVARVVDQDIQRCQAVADRWGATPSASVEDVWDDSSIDAVVVGVPNFLHLPMAVDAMRAGKDVLLEKPMAMNVAECDELVGVAEETKRILQIGFVHRFTSVGMAAKKIADCGDLGEVFHARAHLLHRRGIPGLGGWFTTKAKSGGGCLIDVGVHVTDLLFYLLDQPKWTSISGKANSRFGVKMEHYIYESMWAGPPQLDGTFDVEDSAFALITLESGATIDLQVAWAGNFPKASIGKSQIGLFGDRGGMTFELFGPEIHLAAERNGFNADASLALAATDQMQLQMQDFAEAVARRKPQRGATPDEGRRVQSVIDAIYESSRNNAPVTG